MKAKWIGAGILAAVVAAAVGYTYISSASAVTVINGYVGGEKIGLLEDEEVQKILKKEYHLQMDYQKAGSIEMVEEDSTGMDYLFPSNQTALEIYKKNYGNPEKAEIVLNTPIVLYTRKTVADALIQQDIASENDGVYTVDMQKMAALLKEGKSWSEIGLDQLYGTVSIATTDPEKSNSGNMFAGLLADALAGGTADSSNLDSILPDLETIYGRLGYMESSSADLFEQFLKTGMGAKPIIAGYESQLLEFAVENPDTWKEVKDDIVMLYPTPTVWSSHVYIALDEEGKKGIDALQDEKIQKIAWEKHGFRTGVYDMPSGDDVFGVDGIADEITQVAAMPDADTMEKIMDALK